MSHQRIRIQGRFANIVGLLCFAALLPLIVVSLTFRLLAGLFLQVAIWCCWCSQGRNVLLVYSDSPIWHDYVEERILPGLGERAVVLNWSQRDGWRLSLSVLAFRYFGGPRCFNPMVVVFRPFRLARRFRFHEPFREFKHGRTEAIARMVQELFDLLDGIGGRRAA